MSSSESSRRDVGSFLEPRDPSITNHWMRPRPPHGTNLCQLFEAEDVQSEMQHLRVFLRIKPVSVPSDLYRLQSDTSLLSVLPADGRKDPCRINKLFNFTHIFGPENTQMEVFDKMIKDNLNKFAEGQNFTLMTYGASGSGKTYSLMGTASQPGIVPRCLEFLFARVRAEPIPYLKPGDGGSFEVLTRAQSDREVQLTERILKTCGKAEGRDTSSLRLGPAVTLASYRRMSVHLSRETHVWQAKRHHAIKYEVWVSFVEIYNESVHDLLRSDGLGPPPRLRLVQPPQAPPYLKEVRWVCVRSGAEAFAVLEQGRRRLRFANTNINSHSSRSHCLFTLRLMQYSPGADSVTTSSFQLWDLAGSERAKKTGNEGSRLNESRKINTSLHILERCLQALRTRQAGSAALPPYRESKLTKLLQNALSGNEDIAMLVNVNPEASFFDETQHVLQFSALAGKIMVEIQPGPKTNPALMMSRRYTSIAGNSTQDMSASSLYEELLQLQEELAGNRRDCERRLAVREREVRKEVSDKYREIKQQSDADWQEHCQRQLDLLTQQFDYERAQLVDHYCNRDKPPPAVLQSSPAVHSSHQREVEEAHKYIHQLESSLETKEAEVCELEETCQSLRTTVRELQGELVALIATNHKLNLANEEFSDAVAVVKERYRSATGCIKKLRSSAIGTLPAADSDSEDAEVEEDYIESMHPNEHEDVNSSLEDVTVPTNDHDLDNGMQPKEVEECLVEDDRADYCYEVLVKNECDPDLGVPDAPALDNNISSSQNDEDLKKQVCYNDFRKALNHNMKNSSIVSTVKIKIERLSEFDIEIEISPEEDVESRRLKNHQVRLLEAKDIAKTAVIPLLIKLEAPNDDELLIRSSDKELIVSEGSGVLQNEGSVKLELDGVIDSSLIQKPVEVLTSTCSEYTGDHVFEKMENEEKVSREELLMLSKSDNLNELQNNDVCIQFADRDPAADDVIKSNLMRIPVVVLTPMRLVDDSHSLPIGTEGSDYTSDRVFEKTENEEEASREELIVPSKSDNLNESQDKSRNDLCIEFIDRDSATDDVIKSKLTRKAVVVLTPMRLVDDGHSPPIGTECSDYTGDRVFEKTENEEEASREELLVPSKSDNLNESQDKSRNDLCIEFVDRDPASDGVIKSNLMRKAVVVLTPMRLVDDSHSPPIGTEDEKDICGEEKSARDLNTLSDEDATNDVRSINEKICTVTFEKSKLMLEKYTNDMLNEPIHKVDTLVDSNRKRLMVVNKILEKSSLCNAVELVKSKFCMMNLNAESAGDGNALAPVTTENKEIICSDAYASPERKQHSEKITISEEFKTAKKNNEDKENYAAAPASSRRKLFTRRELDEQVAEVRAAARSTRCLDFGESPGDIRPPPLDKPYHCERILRSARKKRK